MSIAACSDVLGPKAHHSQLIAMLEGETDVWSKMIVLVRSDQSSPISHDPTFYWRASERHLLAFSFLLWF